MGDAAHIVPPTGAKGLNLAASDVYYLSNGFKDFYAAGDVSGLEGYSQKALASIWKALRFSWSMTTMIHRFPDHSAYDRRMQDAEMASLETAATARRLMAESYTGLPF